MQDQPYGTGSRPLVACSLPCFPQVWLAGLAIQEIIIVLTKSELHILAGKNKVAFFKPLQEVCVCVCV